MALKSIKPDIGRKGIKATPSHMTVARLSSEEPISMISEEIIPISKKTPGGKTVFSEPKNQSILPEKQISDSLEPQSSSIINNITKYPISSETALNQTELTKTISSVDSKYSNIPVDGSYPDTSTSVSYISTSVSTNISLTSPLDLEKTPGGEIVFSEDSSNVPSLNTTNVSSNVSNTSSLNTSNVSNDSNITNKLFNVYLEDRKGDTTLTRFSFEYLSYLFFEINLFENIPAFYKSIDSLILNPMIEREEDSGELLLDEEVVKTVFRYIWGLARDDGRLNVMNLIGFYIYFNRRLKFLELLLSGLDLSVFLSEYDLDMILGKILELGLYPVSGSKLFNRVWHSLDFTLDEFSNRLPIRLSLSEYFNYRGNFKLGEVYSGFSIPVVPLILKYNVDMRSWSGKRSFLNSSSAFKKFKEICLDYLNEPDSDENDSDVKVKSYLLDLIPKADSVYLNRSLASESNRISLNLDDLHLFELLSSFDSVFKINVGEINRSRLEELFVMFANDASFPVGAIDDYTSLWVAWADYLNSQAFSIVEEFDVSDAVTHDYRFVYEKLVRLVNSKFLINYMLTNELFVDSGYSGGTDFIDLALERVFASLDVLKSQLVEFVQFVVMKDSRFYADFK